MAEFANVGYVVDGVEGADWAHRGDGTDGTDVAEMALRMNALFYFGCSFHKFKNIAYIGLWGPYAVIWSDRWDPRTDGRTDHSP